MKTEWRPIPGHENFEASTAGQIRNATTHRIVTYHTQKRGGRLFVGLYNTNTHKRTTLNAAPLILRTFVGERPTVEHQAAHVDGDKKDLRLKNLVWMTQSESIKADYARGKRRNGGGGHDPMTPKQRQTILSMTKRGVPQTQIARRLGVCNSAVCKFLKRGNPSPRLQPRLDVVLNLLREHSMISMKAIASHIGLAVSTARYAIRVLEKQRKIETKVQDDSQGGNIYKVL